MVEALFIISGFVIFYIYFGYPFILWLIPTKHNIKDKRYNETEENLPKVSLIIAAYNEEKVIEEKIKNSLELDYPPEKFEILIGSDGSSDKTAEIINQYKDNRLSFYNFQQRRGKTSVLNDLVPKAKGEIIVFSDANAIYQKDAIKKLVRHFEDKSIGAVSGDCKLINPSYSYGTSEGLYYKYERFIQEKESLINSSIGVDGAIYAIRKELFKSPSNNIILDDLTISMEIAKKGYKVIIDSTALAFEKASPDWKDEFRRKTRIGAGIVQCLKQKEGIPNFSNKLLFWQYISHRLLRWWAFFFLITFFILNLFLLDTKLGIVIFTFQIIFYFLALLGWFFINRVKSPIFSIPFYFCMTNLSAFIGFFKGIFNIQKVTWKQAKR